VKISFSLAIVSGLLASQLSQAQLLSVDINGTVRSDVTTPGFTPWYLSPDISGGKTASRSFTNYAYTFDPVTGLPDSTNISLIIPCKVIMTVPAVSDATHYLNANYANKNGNSTSADPNSGWRLSGDGCWSHWKDDAIVVDQPNTNGGAISLIISNLPAGPHTLTTYHNDLWASNTAWHGSRVMSKCIVSVNGLPVFTNTPTWVSTNDSKCGFAFFYITNSYDGQPVVISFDPDHSSVLDFTILNGFEIDRPNPPGTTATAIFPPQGDEHVFANNDAPVAGTANSGYLTLKWQSAGFAISNQLFFGTNADVIANATSASLEYKGTSAAFLGTTNSYNLTNLNSALTYYWRVDQLNTANGITNLVKGYVWSFRTRHLAFPGAEGYGRFARGGRGGVVLEVTHLNDSGPGSYRAAIEASGPRTVVFKVSGLIRLQGPCVIGKGYLTVAGQTAPGDGICLANYRAGLSSCSDVILRFVRCRLGDAAHQAMDGMGLGNSTHSVIDHCSLSWTMDESTSSRQSGAVGSESAMISFQNNVISEPLQYSYHYDAANRTNYEPHAFAGSISGEIGSYHHNLLAHSTDRNWSLAGGLDQSQHYAGSLDLRNNVIYNWQGRTTDGGVQRANYVNNYYKPCPANLSRSANWLLKLDAIQTNWGTETYYMTGNVLQGTSYYTNNWMTGSFVNGLPLAGLTVTNAEIFPSYVDTQSASNAYKVVLSDSGCNQPLPDAIDRRIVGEVLDGTTHYTGTNGTPYIIDGVSQPKSGPKYPGFIDSQNDVKDFTNNPAAPNYSLNAPWPPYATYNVPADTDHDGLPDWWEQIKGLNANSAPGDFYDSNGDPDGDGYTYLEDYLNWLAKPNYSCTNGTPLNVELTQYTRGFTNVSPAYAVWGASGGAVGLSGRTALFTNGLSTNGLGSFKFKVTDNTGFSYTNTVNVRLVSSNAAPNSAPVFSSTVSSRTLNVGVILSITNQASDADAGQGLAYSLPVKPAGATVNATSGVIRWRPEVAQANATHPFSLVVADSGSPILSATQSFNVIVNPLTAPAMVAPVWNTGQMGFLVSGQVGPDYAVQSSSNLVDWNAIFTTNPAVMPFTWSTHAGGLPAQYYRIQVGPPLP